MITQQLKQNLEVGEQKFFLLKWGISINFFKKFILRSETKYNGPLKDPKKNFLYLINFFICKINFLYIKYIYNFKNKNNLKK